MRDYKHQWRVLKAALREEIHNATMRTAQGARDDFDRHQGIIRGLEWALDSLLTVEDADTLPDLEGEDHGTAGTAGTAGDDAPVHHA